MTDFGGKLRLARERRGMSLRQIAASTKISVAALEALERNDVSKLPGGFFSRAFVRAYAIEVGLDPEVTVREFLERFHGEPAPSAIGSAHDEGIFENQQRIAGAVLKLALIGIPLVGGLLYFTLRSRPAAQPPAGAVDATAPASPAVAPVAASIPPPSPIPARPAPPPPAAPAAAGKTMTLELHPTGECWVSLTVDGQRVFSRLMQAGEKDVREVREGAVIEIGNAGAFAFSVDGRPGKPLGAAGQVRTARITKETLAQYVE